MRILISLFFVSFSFICLYDISSLSDGTIIFSDTIFVILSGFWFKEIFIDLGNFNTFSYIDILLTSSSLFGNIFLLLSIKENKYPKII